MARYEVVMVLTIDRDTQDDAATDAQDFVYDAEDNLPEGDTLRIRSISWPVDA